MTKQLFAKLAVRNIQSNKQTYIPYLFSATAIVAMFYLMASLIPNEFIQERSSLLPMMFSLGAIVIAIFSLIFILYTNSFLIKRRKKEIGLYAILGMKKKHVASVLIIESLITSTISIVLGLIGGHIIGQLIFMALNYALNFPVSMDYPFSFYIALLTVAGFALIFLIALLYNISQVTFSNPIKLVKGKQTGEKEPKSSFVLFLLSLIFLGSGYWISITIEDPISAIANFFIAVLLVIVGTYLLFISGSIFILKTLKQNKRIYYRPNAFIAISGMLYRMKQNAAGLANICILATMVIITIATTLTLFVGTEQALENRFPYEHNVTVHEPSAEEFAELERLIQTETENNGLAIKEVESYRYQDFSGTLAGNQFVLKSTNIGEPIPLNLVLIPQEDFERMAGVSLDLNKGEVLFYDSENQYREPAVQLGTQTYSIHPFEELPSGTEIVEQMEEMSSASLVETVVVVTNSMEDIQAITDDYIQKESPEEGIYVGDLMANMGWNTTGTEDEKMTYQTNVQELLDESESSFFYESREAYRAEWYSMNGGFLFVGVFLGLLFTFGAILITYFKQVSEGYDDRQKFQIMQKVGLGKEMIRDSTRSQILWMFFLPLAIAILHVAFAFPIIQKMLMIFGITEAGLIIQSIAAVVLFFSLMYWIIYRVTSRVYYSIVE